MRKLLVLFALSLGLGVAGHAQTTPTSCTGLCLQQMTCPAGQTTSISGVVYAPNGTDPLPNVTVYVPNGPVAAFTQGVSCPTVGAAPSGSPLVGAYTAIDGSFTIPNMPVGTNIPLVIVTGRWRVQTTVNTTACSNTVVPASQTHLPQNQSQGDIPRFAILTGSADQVECVLRKVGIADSEFTGPTGGGRVQMFLPPGKDGPGSQVSSVAGGSGTQATLLEGTSPLLPNYDVLMLPCQGGPYEESAQDVAEVASFVNAGGRLYSSHFSYEWLYGNNNVGGGPFASVANWQPQDPTVGTSASGLATVNTGFSDGSTLSQWLEVTGASTTAAPNAAQITLNQIKHDLDGIVAPTVSYLTLNQPLQAASGTDPAPVMQMVFDTPLNATNQCGRVLFNDYHVEAAANNAGNTTFPAECASGTTLTPQEKLLEYSLFELTNEGNPATLTPASADFGTQPIGFNTAPQLFTFTNNSTFAATVFSAQTTGDFSVVSNTCGSVAAGATCQIGVVFDPTATGARTGVLTVQSTGSTLTATLTGTGIPDLTLAPTSLNFGSLDVGASKTLTLSVNNAASGAVPLPALSTSGDFSLSSSCGTSVPALSTCTLSITFKPTTSGPRTGTLSVNSTLAAYAGASASLSGNGLDFTVAVAPGSGTVIAGYLASTVLTTTPLAGFAAPVVVTCTTNAPASGCTMVPNSFTPSGAVNSAVTISTTSEYNVIGYGGAGGGALWLVSLASGVLVYTRRRSLRTMPRALLTLVMLSAAAASLSGCAGKLPAKNAQYTPATTGNSPYTYTLTVTDGFLVHSATYSLNVTVD